MYTMYRNDNAIMNNNNNSVTQGSFMPHEKNNDASNNIYKDNLR